MAFWFGRCRLKPGSYEKSREAHSRSWSGVPLVDFFRVAGTFQRPAMTFQTVSEVFHVRTDRPNASEKVFVNG
jgi:hypothetical protein